MTAYFKKWGYDIPFSLPRGTLRTLIWHWTAGRYLTVFPSYHWCIQGPPQDGLPVATRNLQNNMRRVSGVPNRDYAAHAWRANSWSVGVAACCNVGAIARANGTFDFGANPLTARQIEALAWLGALVHRAYDVPIESMKTHHEVYQEFVAAGNRPTSFRWDLRVLGETDRRAGGAVLRAKTAWYIDNEDWKAVLA
jgi:hypothetical protein